MKRYLEKLQNKELPQNHILEPGGKIGFHGEGYPPKSMFNGVDIEIKNNRKGSIELELKDNGLFIKLKKDQ